jgi:HAD superfamily hydrolase (TIGR01509 family)
LSKKDFALLWDMDGTIIDTEEWHFKIWQQTFQHHGFELDQHLFKENFGRNNREAIPILLGFDPSPALYETLIEEKEAHFRRVVPGKASLVPGVESWLSTAHEAGIIQVVASSASLENIQTFIDHYHLASYFDALVSGTACRAKPAPDVFLQSAQRINLVPERCCVVEDSLAGVAGAKSAGMTCIAVATTVAKSELFLADYVVNDFTMSLKQVFSALGFEDVIS